MLYSQVLILKNRLKFLGLFVVLILASIGLLWFAYNQSVGRLWTIFAGLIYFSLGFFMHPLYKRAQRELDGYGDKLLANIDNAEKGAEGERVVFAELESLLDKEQYTIYTNFIIPGRRFDIDAIIVGPKGIIVFEIKNYGRKLIFNGDEIFLEMGEKLTPVSPDRDPRNELKRHSHILKNVLVSGGFSNLPIYKAVVFKDKYSASIQRGSKIGVYLISGVEGIEPYIAGLPDSPLFTQEFCFKINRFLNMR